MKKFLAFFSLFLIFASIPNISAEATGEHMVLEQINSTGDVNVKLTWPEVYPDELSLFTISFHDPITDELIQTYTRFDYSVTIRQNDEIIEDYPGEQTLEGGDHFEVVFPEDSQGPAQVSVILEFIRTDEKVLRLDEELLFSVNVVPEFGVIAMIILSVAFVPILLLSKSKLVPKF